MSSEGSRTGTLLDVVELISLVRAVGGGSACVAFDYKNKGAGRPCFNAECASQRVEVVAQIIQGDYAVEALAILPFKGGDELLTR